MRIINRTGTINHAEKFWARLSRYAQRPTNKSDVIKCAHAASIASGLESICVIPLNVGFVSDDMMGIACGKTSAAYKNAVGTTINGEPIMRLVIDQCGSAIIKNQNGIMTRFESEKRISYDIVCVVSSLTPNRVALENARYASCGVNELGF